MEKLLYDGRIFKRYDYTSEYLLKRDILRHVREIFGPWVLFVDAPRDNRWGEIPVPAGYLLDFSIEASPRLHIVEIENKAGSIMGQVSAQLLRLGVAFRESSKPIMESVFAQLQRDEIAMKIVKDAMHETGHKSPQVLLEDLAGQDPSLLLIVDDLPPDLGELSAELSGEVECIIFQTYTCGTEHIHHYTTLFNTWDFDYDAGSEPDTIIIPMGGRDFARDFLREGCWHGVRISPPRLEALKYIAVFQLAPISALTHYTRIERIEPLDKTGKYSIYLKQEPVPIEPLRYQVRDPKRLLRTPRYSYLERILNVEFIEDLF